MKQSEIEELVEEIFSSKKLFELKVLSVSSSKDRVEIINILVKSLIRDTLKSELNFLYMKDMKQFKFSLIINLLFKAFANEWLSFAEEILNYSREKALNEIQDKTRVAFIFSLVREYFLEYKKLFFIEIVDTFFELAEIALSSQNSNTLIEYVLRSSLVKENSIVVVQSYSQFLSRIKSAKNYKSESLSKIQVKIAEISSSLESEKISSDDRELYERVSLQYKKKQRALELSALDDFDGALKRVKETMVKSMSQMKIV